MMHVHPLVFVIVGGILGAGLIAWARRGERRLRTALFALPLIGAVWLAVDFVTTPEDRWLNGITLALAALVAAGAFRIPVASEGPPVEIAGRRTQPAWRIRRFRVDIRNPFQVIRSGHSTTNRAPERGTEVIQTSV